MQSCRKLHQANRSLTRTLESTLTKLLVTEMMQSNSSNEALAKLPHKELILALVERPSCCNLVREFISRYDPFIRQTIARAIRARMTTATYAVIQPLVEDAANETYYRLFRFNCRALRRFRCRYENAIFAYLRTICRNVVSLQMRDGWWSHAGFSLWSIDAMMENCRDELTRRAAAPAIYATRAEANDECQRLEQMIRAGFFQTFCAKHVKRNFIIFKLHFLYGYHLREIANIKALGLSVSGVANTTDRIRRWLRREYKSTPRIRTVKARKVR